MKSTIFENLFVFEMANNHQGSLEHGFNIIDAMADISREYQLNAVVKLQYRQLDTFIHPDFRKREDVKHIPRFISTALSRDEFRMLIERIKGSGMNAMVTPFDEASVDVCLEHDVDIIKVASCSAEDWPLLEKVAVAGKPVIFSTGGVPISGVDRLVSFFGNKDVEFGLMHCVALYPTPNDQLQMGVMRRLAKRYPEVTVGYSGHEAPENLDPARTAVAMGARMMERHVGVPTETIQLNKYSMNPDQVRMWVEAIQEIKAIVGQEHVKELPAEEAASLLSLQRGVFAKEEIRKGEEIHTDQVFFAMPCADGQLTSGQFGSYRATFTASKDYGVNEAVYEDSKSDSLLELREYIHDAKGMLYEARIRLGNDFSVELSHHLGMENFRNTGCLIINVINREYCKKIIVVLPGQVHPQHRHKIKEETFQLLSGELNVSLNGNEQVLSPGDKLLVERGAWHGFSSKTGAIFEEVSTTHVVGDSEYEDLRINDLDPIQRKTIVDRW